MHTSLQIRTLRQARYDMLSRGDEHWLLTAVYVRLCHLASFVALHHFWSLSFGPVKMDGLVSLADSEQMPSRSHCQS